MKIHFAAALIAFAGWLLSPLSAQPQGFNYQALVRDPGGSPVKNHAVSVRIRLFPDSAAGAIAYAETFSSTTNGFGNINLVIGKGTIVSGTFAAVDWSHPMFMETAMDITGGSTFVKLGATQLQSVPYALFAGKTVQTTQTLSKSGDTIMLSNGGGSVVLPPGAAPQTLSQSNDTIFLSAGGGNVKLPAAPQIRLSEIHDVDNNTKISTERNANENIIRFDLNGMEKMRLEGSRLAFVNTGNSVFIGDGAGMNDDLNGRANVFVGFESGYKNTSGVDNTFSGSQAGFSNTTGIGNTFTGHQAGFGNTTGNGNSFSGYATGLYNSTGFSNAFFGAYAGNKNTTGSGNTFSGNAAGYSNTTGNNNTFTGLQTGYSNTTGYNNTFSGDSAGYSNTTGLSNTFTGSLAGSANTTGQGNTFIGTSAGLLNTTGYSNTFAGASAGFINTTGYNNTFMGTGAGHYNTTGYGNVFLGYYSGTLGSDTNKLYINNTLTATPLIFGDFAARYVTINGDLNYTGTLTHTSDRRLKERIAPIAGALGSVRQIQGVYYYWDKTKDPTGIRPRGRQIGVIAQDVEKVYPELVVTDARGFKAVDYLSLTAVLIEAVKEQQKFIEQLKIANGRLESANREMQGQVGSILEKQGRMESLLMALSPASGPELAKDSK